MKTTEYPRISKREFITRVAARSGNLIEVAPEDPLKVVGDGSTRIVEVVNDDRRKVVADVYEALIDELLEVVSSGGSVVLTGFGRFYRQDHKGHKVRFGKSAVSSYPVLKFSASRSVRPRIEPSDGTDPDRPESFGMLEFVDDEDEADLVMEQGPTYFQGSGDRQLESVS
jgi:nucleoid DNA-binding protein